MKNLLLAFLCFGCLHVYSQGTSIKGTLQDQDGANLSFANVLLYLDQDSSLVKVETSDENGIFLIKDIAPGVYDLEATYVGLSDLRIEDVRVGEDGVTDLGILLFQLGGVDLVEATITASRSLVEVKADRTIFNVEGTINSSGSDALSLLRKAPGVTVDNNDNINVLGRSGLLIYVDGKKLPLAGQDLSNYLQSLQAEQIDRIEIISNPGARYEAEGNAGIIDIRLKKDKNLGMNGSLSSSFTQGRYGKGNVNGSGNYRNKAFNIFANGGYNKGTRFMDMNFLSYQNGLVLDEINNRKNEFSGYNVRLGTDFFLSKNHTLGFLVSTNYPENTRNAYNRIEISPENSGGQIDSILVAENWDKNTRKQQTYNINYRFENDNERVINIDLDYGHYESEVDRVQPNRYYDGNEEVLLTEVINSFDTPTDIDIYTFKIDFEEKLWGGKLGIGSKLSRVVSDNTFLFYDVINGEPILKENSSNLFDYDENVYAGYVSYNRSLGEKWSVSAGLRAEQTDATGNLQAFLPELQEPPVELNYLSWFPSAGITWQLSRKQSLALNYGRRINRPDYNILNPFNNQISELSYQKGNPFLRPEIVNNVELGYTLNYKYNFKLAYSRTTDQITRLIAPDDNDPRAGFLTWENLAEQRIWSLSISAPVEVTDSWNAYFNANIAHQDNQADYGDGATVDVQVLSYTIYSQQTFELPKDFKFEVSGYYSGPGIWGGVFEYESSWSISLGLQKKLLKDQLTMRLGVKDIFNESGWSGKSNFDGLLAYGNGHWDSRAVTISASYRFGNQNVKSSRKRKTGLEDEKSRVGSGD